MAQSQSYQAARRANPKENRVAPEARERPGSEEG
jgi:hypothetical protein